MGKEKQPCPTANVNDGTAKTRRSDSGTPYIAPADFAAGSAFNSFRGSAVSITAVRITSGTLAAAC